MLCDPFRTDSCQEATTTSIAAEYKLNGSEDKCAINQPLAFYTKDKSKAVLLCSQISWLNPYLLCSSNYTVRAHEAYKKTTAKQRGTLTGCVGL